MNQTQQRFGFIGAGKLAGSVLRGLIESGFCAPLAIIASEPNHDARNAIASETGVETTTSNLEVAETAEVILIGTKPGVVLPALREMAAKLKGKLVISLAAGVRLERMEALADARFMRAMTNTPSAVREASTGLARGARTTDADMALTKKMFGTLGTVVEVREDQIDAVTALGGSGPAFVYSVIQALADGGERSGLDPQDALAIATQTVLGAARLAKERGRPMSELIAQVVTPGGTTAAGLAAMEKMKSLEGLSAAVEAATKRGQEMAKENS